MWWRLRHSTLVRVARLIWADQREEVIADLLAEVHAVGQTELTKYDLARVWDLGPCPSRAFTDAMVRQIKHRLLWPDLVTSTLPVLLGEYMHTKLEAVSYTCDEATFLDVVCKEVESDTGETHTFRLKLGDGQVQGTTVNLMARGFMFHGARDASGMNSEYSLESQYTWAKKIACIPEIQRCVRVVNQSSWFIFKQAEGIWDEVSPKHPRLKQKLSEVVREYFLPLYTFLDFKSGFDPACDTRRAKLEKILSRFGNSEHLDRILDALQADETICINEFNDLFNRDPYVLPCANGMLDFRTLELRDITREDFVTYKTPAVWNADADTQGANAFLRSLWPVDTDAVVDFVKAWLGYCLTGLTQMQIMVFMIGLGSNGKSKLSMVMENILGRVGFGHVTYEALCQRTGGPNEELFEARNARMWQVCSRGARRVVLGSWLGALTDVVRARAFVCAGG